jgi:pimeloyl-ACP methyl ester carboxylesterase
MTTIRRGSFTSRGLRLAYGEAGAGLPLLLLHAFPLSGEMWDPQVEALAGQVRVIVPDLSGFGESEAIAPEFSPESACDMSDFAADAVALLDHLELDRAVVAGLSMGGYAALALCEAAPERLRGLVLADTRSGADSEEGRQGRLDIARRVLKEGTGFLAETLPAKLLGRTTRAERPEVVARVERMIRDAPPAGVAAAQRGMARRPDRTAILERIAVPVLVVVGEEDELTPPEESRNLQRRIAGAELVTIPEAGHLSSLERPDTFSEALGEFLRRLS